VTIALARLGLERAEVDLVADPALAAGTVIEADNSGGGGYGPPAARPHSLVDGDLRNGMISEQTARQFHHLSAASLPPIALHHN
jgi:N-methylhydantoinase B/oxoprolinase/acetone carboxylase alpha subunit